MYIYVSSYNSKNNITLYHFNKKSIILDKISTIGKPSYICKHKNTLFVALKSSNDNEKSGYAVYKIKHNKLLLIENNENVNSFTHIYVDNKNILCASYHQELIYIKDRKKGIETYREYANSKIHQVGYIAKLQKYFAIDLENNKIYIFKIKSSKIIEETTISCKGNKGARHIATLKHGNNFYLVNEIKSTISNFKIKRGIASEVQTLSTIVQKGIDNFASAIKICFPKIFVSNRGANTLTIFNIVKDKIEYQTSINAFGITPRDFELTAKYIVIANQDSNNIKILLRSNFLQVVETINVEKPVCLLVRRK